MMDIGRIAYVRLYGREPLQRITVRYHGGFKDFNANVRMNQRQVVFSLSKKFESLEDEIKIGVIQHLLNKLFKTRVETDEQDLYSGFLKRMSDFAPVTQSDPVLGESFDRVNKEYFADMMSRPNLTWGSRSKRLLGTYTYATDTIMISAVLQDSPTDLLDYVMHHEMLHKKHKFSCKSGRTHSHTPAFKRDEAKFKVKNAETMLQRWIARRPTTRRPERSFLQKVMGLR